MQKLVDLFMMAFLTRHEHQKQTDKKNAEIDRARTPQLTQVLA